MSAGAMELDAVLARYPGAEVFRFGDSAALSAELLALVRAGRKTATCEAVRNFPAQGEAEPVLGRRDIALEWDGRPALVVETVWLRRCRFDEVDEGFALDEGEDDSLEGWRAGHRAYFERTGGAPLEHALISVLAEGEVRAAVGTQSNGQGHETAWAQIIHEKLGVPLEKIALMGGDSDLLPAGGGTGGSRSLIMASRVFLKAADAVIEKARDGASALLEAAPADVEYDAESGGLYRIKGTDRAVTLFEAAAELGGVTGTGEVNDAHATFPNGCHVAEVEIDPETGRLELVRYTIVDDFGTVINPMIVEGQVHGGVAQGAGQVMGERAVYDPETGQPLTGSFMDYWMPRAADLPFFDFDMSPTMATTNPLGVKGCGEAGSVGAIPALALAVQDALRTAGAEVIAPPYPPHRLWEALAARRG